MLPYVVIAAIVIGIVLSIALPRRKRRAAQADRVARLQEVAAVVGGTVTAKDLRLSGTYGGRAVTATLVLADPRPISAASNSGMGNNQVEMLRVHVAGDGGAAWHVWPGIKPPFGERHFEYVHHDGAGQFLQMLTRVDALRTAPEVEEALRAAGLFELVGQLAESTSWHPQVRFTPDLARLMGGRMPPGIQPPPGAGPPPTAKGGYDLELRRGGTADPTPDTFRHVLDVALQIAALNERVNPVRPA